MPHLPRQVASVRALHGDGFLFVEETPQFKKSSVRMVKTFAIQYVAKET